jgi:hypothetical protein
MSRTNHHRRYDWWNMKEPDVYWGKPWSAYEGQIFVEERTIGMEVWDLRFYAGCRRTPQVIHRVLDFHDLYPVRIHYGRDGVAKSYGDIREGQFRTATRRYVDEARMTYNAGGDVDEICEPDKRPRSIDWDLW